MHLAAETGTGQSLTEASRHAHLNVYGTDVMLDALSRHGQEPNHIVLTSSRAVYGEGCWSRSDGRKYYPGQRDRNQLARSIDVMLEANPTLPAPLSLRKPERTFLVLLTPALTKPGRAGDDLLPGIRG